MKRYINWQNFLYKGDQVDIVNELVKGAHKDENTLVVAGTAAGKTGLKLLLIDYLLKLHGENILIPVIVPKQVIAAQHTAFLRKCMHLSEKQIVRIDGSILPKKRVMLLKEAIVPVATSECLVNDIVNFRCDIDKIQTVLIDEIHNGLGDHDIVNLAKLCRQRNIRIIGFTASDGATSEKIEEHLRNLHITHHIFTQRRKRVDELRHEIPKTPELETCLEYGEIIKNDSLNYLLNRKMIPLQNRYSHDEIKGFVRTLRHALEGGQRHPHLFQGIKHLAILGKMNYLEELILTGTFHDARVKLNEIFREDSKSSQAIRMHEYGQRLLIKLEEIHREKTIHPKLAFLQSLLQKYDSNERKIIFVNDHLTGIALKAFIDRRVKIPCTTIFGNQHMKFKEAKQRLHEFAEGETKIVISTSVLEEGIHVPDIDRVIHYQMGNRAIALTQRNGRTGRTSAGIVEYLLMENSIEIVRYIVGKQAEEFQQSNILRALKNINAKLPEAQLTQTAQLNLNYLNPTSIPIVKPMRKYHVRRNSKPVFTDSPQLSFKNV